MWKHILQLNKVGDTKKNGRNSMDKGSPGTNPGEPAGVGIQWTSYYHNMQKKTQISIETLLNEYEDIVKQIPECIMQTAIEAT